MASPNPYESEELQAVCGSALRPGGLALTSEALELGAFSPGAKILDLGCGAGSTLKLLKERGFEATGLDISSALLDKARQHGPVLEGDFHQIPLAGESLEGIFCECALSLARDKRRVLSECARVLKAGGRLLITDVFLTNTQPPEDRPEEIGNCSSGAETLESLGHKIKLAGFSIKKQLDCSRALRELAARLVWHFGSTRALTEIWGEENLCRLPGRPLSYFLLLAVKK